MGEGSNRGAYHDDPRLATREPVDRQCLGEGESTIPTEFLIMASVIVGTCASQMLHMHEMTCGCVRGQGCDSKKAEQVANDAIANSFEQNSADVRDTSMKASAIRCAASCLISGVAHPCGKTPNLIGV